MTRYFSTFFTGLSKVVEEALKSSLENLKIEELSDGLVLYETSSPSDRVSSLRFLNNTFTLLEEFKDLGGNPTREMVLKVLENPGFLETTRISLPRKPQKFRVMAKEDQLVHIDKKPLERLENTILTLKFLELDRANPDIEFWFLTRQEGYGFFGVRITKRPNYEKTLEKGQLYPELAYLMCLISEPSDSDVFLDPFASSGAIPNERKTLPHAKTISSDIRGYENPWDARKLPLEDNSVDKIVTDPPWSMRLEQIEDLPKFYSDVLKELSRVLKPNGIMIILTAQKEVFEKVLEDFSSSLRLEKKYDTLVSGKKAGIYKLKNLPKQLFSFRDQLT